MISPTELELVSFQDDSGQNKAYLDVVSLMVVATFAEESVVDDTMDIELIKERIAVLELLSGLIG